MEIMVMVLLLVPVWKVLYRNDRGLKKNTSFLGVGR